MAKQKYLNLLHKELLSKQCEQVLSRTEKKSLVEKDNKHNYCILLKHSHNLV